MADFSDRTFENILDEMLDSFPDNIDVREGSVAYDAVVAQAYKIAEFYAAIESCYDEVGLLTASGEYLDRFALEHGLQRIQATCAEYALVHTGTDPEVGAEFYCDSADAYFTIVQADNGDLRLRCQESGTDFNSILSGELAIPVDNIDGLESSTFGEMAVHAIDEEEDEALRARIQAKISGPAENGNKSQYKVWCESVEGVGRAIINPLKYGPNTVEAVLISSNGTATDSDVVANVQEFVDPKDPAFEITDENENVISLGSGYGEGVAPIGAHFIAKSATAYGVNITLDVELLDGKTLSQAESEIEEVVTAYLKELALTADDISTIRITKIGSLIEQTDAVFDYSNLKINNQTSNITISDDEVFVLSGVTANEHS